MTNKKVRERLLLVLLFNPGERDVALPENEQVKSHPWYLIVPELGVCRQALDDNDQPAIGRFSKENVIKTTMNEFMIRHLAPEMKPVQEAIPVLEGKRGTTFTFQVPVMVIPSKKEEA